MKNRVSLREQLQQLLQTYQYSDILQMLGIIQFHKTEAMLPQLSGSRNGQPYLNADAITQMLLDIGDSLEARGY